MEVTIGNRVQIGSAVFALERGGSAWLKFSIADQNDIRLNVRVLSTESNTSRIFAEEDYGVLEIPDPKGVLGQTTAAPIYMGHHGGLQTYLSYQCYPYGHSMQLCIQIYTENE